MDVRTGYKQTEVGMIPKDWGVEPLGVVATFHKGKGLPKSELDPFGVTPCIHYGELFTQYPETIRNIISRTNSCENRFRSITNDVLMPTSDVTPSGLAKASCVTENGIILGGDILVIRTNKNCVYGPFLSYLIRHSRERVLQLVTGTTVYHIYAADMKKFRLLLPPVEEQQAIAEALSDAEAYIQSLEQLIAKKRFIKQGAMQELLTGKRRLPGFSGEWEAKTIEDAADCLDNLRVPLNDSQRSKMKGDIPYCGANGVLDYINDYVVDDDIILIAEDGGYFDEYAYRPIAYRMKGRCWVNNHAHILKAKAHVSQGFLYYSLVHKNILRFLASGTRAKLNKSEMYKIEVDMPDNKNEQIAIAEALSDMDVEIGTLGEMLKKARQIKQGMIQELLTGRIRLI